MEASILSQLFERIGADHASKRLKLQAKHSALRTGGHGDYIFEWENVGFLTPTLKVLLKITGLWERAVQNSTNYQIHQAPVYLSHLPSAFHGFRILHLSDLHVESIADRGQQLQETLSDLSYDLCVITGDFRFLTYGGYDKALNLMAKLTKAISCPHGIIGILGNHDFIEMVPGLEDLGIQMLLNESFPIARGEETIWVVGVDDPHWYEVDDLSKALRAVPANAIKILLAHSQELIKEAASKGIDYYLCGHSHGGQMCLPGSIPIITNSRCARKFISGPWQHQRMQGYTSRGTGCSVLPVRFFCQPEIIVHRLVGLEPSQL